MARTWAKQVGDLKILEALYHHKYLRGKVLTQISGHTPQKGRDRISALKRQGLISGEAFVKPTKAGARVMNKKVAAIYYLTRKGVVAVKSLITKEAIHGDERGKRPNEEEKEKAYRVSLLLEGLFDIYDTFSAPAGYKTDQDIPNFVPIALVNGNNLIFFDNLDKQRNMTQKIIVECHRLQDRFQNQNTLILTENTRSRNNFVNYSIENYGQEERILVQGDFDAIRYLLDPAQEFKNCFLNSGIEIEELDTPYDGCHYVIDGELANIFDIVGMPAKTLRRVKRAPGIIHLLVSNPSEQKRLFTHYPDYETNENIVVHDLSKLLENDEDIFISAKPPQGDDKWAQALRNYTEQRGEDASL